MSNEKLNDDAVIELIQRFKSTGTDFFATVFQLNDVLKNTDSLVLVCREGCEFHDVMRDATPSLIKALEELRYISQSMRIFTK